MIKYSLGRLVFACAIACPALAAAQASNVEIYGTLLPFIDNVHTTGATGAARAQRPNQVPAAAYTGVNVSTLSRMTSGTSNLGFRGHEDLGGGLKAIWQIEGAAPLDGLAPSNVAGRNTGVGLAGAWGTLIFGNWDTPYKFITIPVSPLRGMNPFDPGIISNPGFGVPVTTTQFSRTGTRADAAFSRRQGNSVQYWAPNVGGFAARADYSFGEVAGLTNGADVSPTLWSVAAFYDAGGLSLRYAYERHKDYFGLAQIGGSPVSAGNAASKDDGHQFVAMYKFGDTRVSWVFERLKYRSDDMAAGAVDEYARNAWYLLVQQRFGAQQVWGAYGRANDGNCHAVGGAACSTTELGASQWSVGYSYSFSKRTDVYASYFGVNTGASSTYGIFPPVPPTTPGADSRGVGIGILHSF